VTEPYVRVYYSIIGDPKFASVYSDDHHLAWWLRLLLGADAIWPAPAPIPMGIRKGSLAELVRVGLVDMVGPHHYRIHGLDAERNRRSDAARNAAAVRWQSGRNAGASGSEMPRQAKPSRDEQSQAEPDGGAFLDEWDIFDVYFRLTGNPPRSQKLRDFLTRMGETFGYKRFGEALGIEYGVDRDLGTLIGRARDRLAIEDHEAEKVERAAEKRRLAEKHAPIRVVRPDDYDAISDEEAERQAEAMLGRSAS